MLVKEMVAVCSENGMKDLPWI